MITDDNVYTRERLGAPCLSRGQKQITDAAHSYLFSPGQVGKMNDLLPHHDHRAF